jgi:hypothetical protein
MMTQTTQTKKSPLQYEDYRDLPDRITVRWLQSLTDEELREVMRCVDEEQDYWQKLRPRPHTLRPLASSVRRIGAARSHADK